MHFVMPDEGAGYGALLVFRASGQTTMVDPIVFASAADAGRFITQALSVYQSMGSTPTRTDLGDESFALPGEVLVRSDRYVLHWVLGATSPEPPRPSVLRLQTFVRGGP
jgi:hypothetical protein